MDGNGRWAQARGLPRAEGHRRGAVTARSVIRTTGKMGIPWLTLYAFSTENWGRPEAEKTALFALMMESLRREVAGLKKEGIRFRVVGDPAPLPARLRRLLEDAEERTSGEIALNLSVCMNYSGRAEIVNAVRRLMEHPPETIDEAAVKGALDTRLLPPVDLLLRTGGESRISNFLLWDAAYAELFFTPTLWPEFGVEEYTKVLAAYRARERRYGRV